MTSLPEVTPSGMTVPERNGAMLGKAASAVCSCASPQVVSQSNSAGRGISRQIARGISLRF